MAKRKTARRAKRAARPVVDVNAKVVATGGKPDPVTYRLEAGNAPSEQYVTGPTTITIPRSQDLYKIHFHLDDSDCTQKLRFRLLRPICAQDGSGCPTKGGITTGQLKRRKLEEKRLVIDDYNYAKGKVGFALFFMDKKTKAPVKEFDPIIENGGGGISDR